MTAVVEVTPEERVPLAFLLAVEISHLQLRLGSSKEALIAADKAVALGTTNRVAHERLAAALPNARFAPIPQAAHYPQIEQPETVAVAIERFALGEDR